MVRSSSGELVLESPPAGAGGSGGASATAGGRLIIISTDPLASFPAGAQVWLSKTRGPDPVIPSPIGESVPGTFSVRDRRAGTLLLGFNDDALAAPASPIRTGEAMPLCTKPRSDRCVAMETNYALTFVGDTPVVVRDGESAEIVLGGAAYDVRVSAWRQTLHSPFPDGCVGDGIPRVDGLKFDIKARNLAELVAGLPVTPPN